MNIPNFTILFVLFLVVCIVGIYSILKHVRKHSSRNKEEGTASAIFENKMRIQNYEEPFPYHDFSSNNPHSISNSNRAF